MFPYAWLRKDAPPRPFGDHSAIKQDYLPADYRRDSAGLGIVETVHVEAAPGAADPAAETRWLEALADSAGLPDASVAHIDLLAPTLDRDLELLMANGRLRGVRVGIAWRDRSPWRFAAGPGLARDDRFRAGAARLARTGLSLDVIALPEQLFEIADLAEELPGLPIIIDHLGQMEPDLPGNEAVWREGIAKTARCPNVAVKLSGLWTISRGWEADRLAGPVRHVVERFGPGRCMWGSNLPIERLMCDMAHQLRTLEAILADLSPEDRASIFGDTARRLYRLSARVPAG